MELTIISEDENPMLHRTDVTFEVSHVEATPDRLAVRDSLAARLNKGAEEVIIRRLDTKFGMRTTLGEAKVYEAPEFARDVEQDYMLARNKIGTDGETPEDATPADEEPEVENAGDAEAEADAETEEADDDGNGAEAVADEDEADAEAEEAE